jgi:starch-binding outer membrane protein, SusD/RagB family
MKNIKFLKSAFVIGLTLSSITSCTDLEEKALDGVIQSGGASGLVNTAAFLETAKNGLREFQAQGQMFAMGEMSGDGLVGPTRGGDWDDNGAWRQLHTHTWDPLHIEVRGSWNSLLSNVYNCNQVIGNNGTPSEILQARFLRAFYYYHVVDLFGKAPYRLIGSDPQVDPLVWTRPEATAFCISELEAILPSLPTRVSNDPSEISKDAANFLLAKLYLNKAVFDGSGNFAAADMTKVVQNVDALTNTK